MNEDASGSDTPPVDIRIVTTGVTAQEIAAATTVIEASLAALADDDADQPAVRVSGWNRSQRDIRQPVITGVGAWRSFTGR